MHELLKQSETIMKKEKIVEIIRGLHTIRKKTMSKSHYEKLIESLPYPTLEEIDKLFGSWESLLKASGVIVNSEAKAVPQKTVKKKKIRWSAEKSLAKYKELRGSRISQKTYEDLRKSYPKMMGSHGIIYYYGTWKNAVLRNNLKLKGVFTNDECLQYLKQARLDLGKHFSSNNYSHWVQQNNGPSLSLIISRFNSWNKAIETLENSFFKNTSTYNFFEN